MKFENPCKSTTARLLLWLCMICPGGALAEVWSARMLLEFTRDSCSNWDQNRQPAPGYSNSPINQSDIEIRGRYLGQRYRLQVSESMMVELEVIERNGTPARYVSLLFGEFGDPIMLMSVDSVCNMQVARKVNYNDHGQALNIVTLDRELNQRDDPDWLNPPLEFVEREPPKPLKHPGDSSPLRVGMVDSGVNYRLPEINRRLARDDEGRLIGFDFWDMDELPYDAHPVNSGFFVQRHGTRTASLLLAEAPEIELVPYRYPRPDMSRMQALVEHAAQNQVHILGMPLGSNRLQDWSIFGRSARAHPKMLFIVSAGNDGRDIDERPVYPAALDLDNVLVVTSADDFLRPAHRTNWGPISVDYLLPAERIPVTDYSGKNTFASGSSYAVARLTALAARLQHVHRHWRAADIIAEIRERYAYRQEQLLNWVSTGYIADPLANEAPKQAAPIDLEINSVVSGSSGLALDLLVLDPQWSREAIEAAVQQAYDILAQCGVAVDKVTLRQIDSADYLRDLSTGSAYTVMQLADPQKATVVFARDTRMQAAYLGEAFGLGNTRRRPWLRNSVWLMHEVDDPGVALAHELFHVLANSGAHVEGMANLMQARTRPESLNLTPDQCRQARVTGLANGLLQDRKSDCC